MADAPATASLEAADPARDAGEHLGPSSRARLAPLLQLLDLLGDDIEELSEQEVNLTLDFGPLDQPSKPRPDVSAQLQLALDVPQEPPSARAARKRSESRAALLASLFNPELTLREAALLLNVCPTTVRRYTNSGQLPHYRTPGNQRRFRLTDVLAFMSKYGKR